MTTDDIAGRLEKLHEQVRRQLEPLSATLRALEDNSAFAHIQRTTVDDQKRMRALIGPLDDLRKAVETPLSSTLSQELESLQKLANQYEQRFTLPEVGETAKLLEQFKLELPSLALARFAEPPASLQKAIESMRSPWLDLENTIASMKGFGELQSIGFALNSLPSFDPQITDALRLDLGDWRKKIAWPADIFDNPVARSAFYQDMGLNASLTDFPASAFEQSVEVAGLRGDLPPPKPLYTQPPKPDSEEGDDEAAFQRTNEAHDQLQRLETHMRQFINEQMTSAFGANWIRHRVPEPMRKAWSDKRNEEKRKDPREWPLIAYADFTDYVQIITKRDNWSEVFQPYFNHKDSVQESFRRLHPIRVCTMHARLISQDDELYLYVETKRLLKAIGIEII